MITITQQDKAEIHKLIFITDITNTIILQVNPIYNGIDSKTEFITMLTEQFKEELKKYLDENNS